MELVRRGRDFTRGGDTQDVEFCSYGMIRSENNSRHARGQVGAIF